jgi:PIN domain nuclease of toxin-antitoxin system
MTQGYLLDTHTFLWAARAPEKLSRKARRICESPTKPLRVSAISLWELIAKCEAGSLEIPSVGSTLPVWLERLSARVLPLEAAHVLALYGLPLLHHDPFDRALLAQAQVEELTLVTRDEDMHRYTSVKWVW